MDPAEKKQVNLGTRLAELTDTIEKDMAIPGQVVRRRHNFRVTAIGDRVFNLTTLLLALVTLALLFGLTAVLVVQSMPSIKQFGFGFLVSTNWDPANDSYGALPFIYGTVVSSAVALLIAVPLSLGVALCLSEMARASHSRQICGLVELLAAIHSVVYGPLAVFVVVPWLLEYIEPPLG